MQRELFGQICKVNIAKTNKSKTSAFWKARLKSKQQYSTSTEMPRKYRKAESEDRNIYRKKKDKELKKAYRENLIEYDKKMKKESDQKCKIIARANHDELVKTQEKEINSKCMQNYRANLTVMSPLRLRRKT